MTRLIIALPSPGRLRTFPRGPRSLRLRPLDLVGLWQECGAFAAGRSPAILAVIAVATVGQFAAGFWMQDWLLRLSVIGLCGIFVNGLVTWLAMQPAADDDGAGLPQAARRTWTCFPALVIVFTMRAALRTIGSAGLIVLLCAVCEDTTRLPAPLELARAVMRQTAWSAYATIVHDPSPADSATQKLSDASSLFIRNRLMHAGELSPQSLASQDGYLHSATALLVRPGVPVLILISLLLFVVVDTCTQFHTVFILRHTSIFGALAAGARLSSAHFGRVAAHIWLLRLLTQVSLIAFVVLPSAWIQYGAGFGLSRFAGIGIVRAGQVCVSVCLVCAQIVVGVFVAVYTARLCQRLQCTAPHDTGVTG